MDSQVDALVSAGAVRVFQEYASGATQARARWVECLDYLQPGNVLMVADLTRLGRSTADLADIVTVLGQRGIGFRSLAEPWLDTTSAHGRLIFDMFASLAEYERSRLSERTKAGLAGRRPRTMTEGKLETALLSVHACVCRTVHEMGEGGFAIMKVFFVVWDSRRMYASSLADGATQT